jgi:tRNA A-37 threonylcarbamoyl transferase component Bud32
MNIPERLGKYPIAGVLGKGAMGVVYRAHDPVIKRQVVIKTIRRELIEDDEKADMIASRFRKEAQAAGSLTHPGIVSVYEYGEDEKYAYIAMEYVEGNSLRDYFVKDTKFEERDIVSIMAQLLDALEYAHNRAVWHRDIKPANIIVMNNGRIKLTDFGIARVESAERTHTNLVMGTPGYIAPEYYLGQTIDHRVDIFSAGVVFFHLLAGQAPFKGTPEAIMHNVCYHDPEPPSRADPRGRWPAYDAVVSRALMKRAEDRFPSAAAFRSAILDIYDHPISDTVSESTIMSQVVRTTPTEGGPASPSKGGAGAPTGTATPLPTGWDAPAIAKVELALARFVGPVARVLVRRAARQCHDLDTLANLLTESLATPQERDAFLAAVLGRATIATTRISRITDSGTSRTGGTPAGSAATPEEIERIARILTKYIGPIAKVVTKRVSTEGLGRYDLCVKVAQHVGQDADRERFLREVGAA